jgi:hypothetical protein
LRGYFVIFFGRADDLTIGMSLKLKVALSAFLWQRQISYANCFDPGSFCNSGNVGVVGINLVAITAATILSPSAMF